MLVYLCMYMVQCCATQRNAMEAQAQALNATIRSLSLFLSIFLRSAIVGGGGEANFDDRRGDPPGGIYQSEARYWVRWESRRGCMGVWVGYVYGCLDML